MLTYTYYAQNYAGILYNLPTPTCIGNCGPLPSANGYVLPYTSTLEGSRVMFMCKDDPLSELTAVCTRAGKWEPSPVDICDASSKLNQITEESEYVGLCAHELKYLLSMIIQCHVIIIYDKYFLILWQVTSVDYNTCSWQNEF
jgi:hypothetical protein